MQLDLHLPSFLTLSLTLALLIILIIIKITTPTPTLTTTKYPPSPKPLPIIGNLLHLVGDLPHRSFHRLSLAYGPIMLLRLGSTPFLIASSPDAALDITKTHDAHFSNRPPLTLGNILMYDGSGIVLSPYGDHWRQLRKITTVELLTARRVASFYRHRYDQVMTLVNDIRRSTTTVNLSSKVTTMTNNIAALCVFGKSCEQSMMFISMLKVASGFLVAEFVPHFKYVDLVTGLTFRARRIHRRVDRILEAIMEEHRAKAAARGKVDEEEDDDLVDVLLRIKLSGELKVPLTDDNIKAIILVSS